MKKGMQRNSYRGGGPRPWLELDFRDALANVRTLKLVADTGSPQAVVLAPAVFDELVLIRIDSITNNFGKSDGGWLQLYMPDCGLVERIKGFANPQVEQIVRKSHPDFAGLVGLPILRLGEYGGDANSFWFQYPPSNTPSP
jgi:hypothetical protein